MKKLFISIVLVAAAAFSANSQIRVEAIGDFSKLTFTEGSVKQDTKAEFGFGLRAFYTVASTDDAGIDVGLGYMFTKSSNDATKATISINSLQLPFHGYYSWNLGNVTVTPYAGFYFGYALSGKTTFDASIAEVDADPFEGDYGLKKFDLGSDDEIIVKFGGHFNVGAGLQYSFLNLCKSKDVRVDATTFFFSLGYSF